MKTAKRRDWRETHEKTSHYNQQGIWKRRKDKDKRRIAYYQFYTDRTWGDMRNYHICLDSGALGMDKCAEIIIGI